MQRDLPSWGLRTLIISHFLVSLLSKQLMPSLKKKIDFIFRTVLDL